MGRWKYFQRHTFPFARLTGNSVVKVPQTTTTINCHLHLHFTFTLLPALYSSTNSLLVKIVNPGLLSILPFCYQIKGIFWHLGQMAQHNHHINFLHSPKWFFFILLIGIIPGHILHFQLFREHCPVATDQNHSEYG